jgi:hypothetical protein
MSRIKILDHKNNSNGEVHGIVDRGWSINDAGSCQVTLGIDEARNKNIQFGSVVYIAHPKLPAWAGVIDPPWSGTLPVVMTMYDIPYLIGTRGRYKTATINGTAGALLIKLLDWVNTIEETYIRPGNINMEGSELEYPIDYRDYWTQMKDMVVKSGYEMMFRPVYLNHKLVTYIDLQKQLGVETPATLQDGEGGNCTLDKFEIDGTIGIWNSIRGTTNDSVEIGRKYTDEIRDNESVRDYRLRNKLVQFDVSDQATLEAYTANYLDTYKKPKVKLTVTVKDIGNIFYYLRLGNIINSRFTKVALPGGIIGWSGNPKITTMTYLETSNTVSMALEGTL